jgi:hypothetical protein
MSADLDFLDELLRGLDDSALDWVEARVRRIRESRKIVMRKTIIRKE